MTQGDTGFERPLEIQVEEVKQLLPAASDKPSATESSVLLIDCREPEEFSMCRIEGASLMPLQTLPDQLDQLASDPKARMVIYCHHGVRSLQAAVYLRQQGFSQAQSMAGGIDQWSLVVDPDVRRY